MQIISQTNVKILILMLINFIKFTNNTSRTKDKNDYFIKKLRFKNKLYLKKAKQIMEKL